MYVVWVSFQHRVLWVSLSRKVVGTRLDSIAVRWQAAESGTLGAAGFIASDMRTICGLRIYYVHVVPSTVAGLMELWNLCRTADVSSRVAPKVRLRDKTLAFDLSRWLAGMRSHRRYECKRNVD